MRDDSSCFISAKSALFLSSLKPVEAEAMAFLEAINWLTEMGYDKPILESDYEAPREREREAKVVPWFEVGTS